MSDEITTIVVGFVLGVLTWTVRFVILGCGVYIVVKVLRVLEVIQ